MSVRSRVAAIALSGVLWAAVSAALQSRPGAHWPSLSFPPDLLAFLASVPALVAQPIAAFTAGAVTAFVAAKGERGQIACIAFAFANPLVGYALTLGAGASLALAALTLVISAVAFVIRERDHNATVGLGLAAAVAPFVSNAVLLLYPVIIILAPFVSPWGAEPKRLAGFLVAILAPLAMALLAALYLRWLVGAPDAIAAGFDGVPRSDMLLVVAGAALIAVAGACRTRVAGLGAFAAGAAIFAAARPDIVAHLVTAAR